MCLGFHFDVGQRVKVRNRKLIYTYTHSLEKCMLLIWMSVYRSRIRIYLLSSLSKKEVLTRNYDNYFR